MAQWGPISSISTQVLPIPGSQEQRSRTLVYLGSVPILGTPCLKSHLSQPPLPLPLLGVPYHILPNWVAVSHRTVQCGPSSCWALFLLSYPPSSFPFAFCCDLSSPILVSHFSSASLGNPRVWESREKQQGVMGWGEWIKKEHVTDWEYMYKNKDTERWNVEYSENKVRKSKH